MTSSWSNEDYACKVNENFRKPQKNFILLLYLCTHKYNLHIYIYNMENNNKYIAVAYQLYTIENDKAQLAEIATEKDPFIFISGFGTTLEDFEKEIVGLSKGDSFDFTLTPEQAYGEFVKERVVELNKDIFCIDGRFDKEHIYIDAIVPLQNQEGDRFMGRVIEIGDQQVTIDLNHPFAGKELNFKGEIVESREATEEEIRKQIDMLCGKGCKDCEGGDCENGCGGCGGCH